MSVTVTASIPMVLRFNCHHPKLSSKYLHYIVGGDGVTRTIETDGPIDSSDMQIIGLTLIRRCIGVSVIPRRVKGALMAAPHEDPPVICTVCQSTFCGGELLLEPGEDVLCTRCLLDSAAAMGSGYKIIEQETQITSQPQPMGPPASTSEASPS
jgi:hypothetical protein